MNKNLPILAVETSGELCSAAVLLDDNCYAEGNINQKHVHSEKLISLIESTMKNADVKLHDIGHIAISVGPGSFTGLRIGMAAVKGMAFGAALPVVPVPAFEALAHKICSFIKDETEFIIANNVNISELYFAKFVKSGYTYKVIETLSLIKKTRLEYFLNERTLVFGNYYQYSSLNSVAFPSALDVAKWSFIFGQDLLNYDYDYLEPNYLKNFDIKVKR